jgi:hypothetical protein
MVRLNTLAKGLGREVQLSRNTAHPLTYLELKVYIDALQDGIGRLEEARAVLPAGGCIMRMRAKSRDSCW